MSASVNSDQSAADLLKLLRNEANKLLMNQLENAPSKSTTETLTALLLSLGLLEELKNPPSRSTTETLIGLRLFSLVGLALVIAPLFFEGWLVFKFWLLVQLLGQKDSSVHPSDLSSIVPSDILLPSEFIIAISLGTLLAVFPLLLKMYQDKMRVESVRLHLKNCAQIIETLADSQKSTPREGGRRRGEEAPRS